MLFYVIVYYVYHSFKNNHRIYLSFNIREKLLVRKFNFNTQTPLKKSINLKSEQVLHAFDFKQLISN